MLAKLRSRATLSYSARRYNSAVCYSKMSCDAFAFLSEALYEADKALEKFAAAPQECAC